eukprot:scaffold107336_cov19-Prasinocladus_malaysianus.AAC.1
MLRQYILYFMAHTWAWRQQHHQPQATCCPYQVRTTQRPGPVPRSKSWPKPPCRDATEARQPAHARGSFRAHLKSAMRLVASAARAETAWEELLVCQGLLSCWPPSA